MCLSVNSSKSPRNVFWLVKGSLDIFEVWEAFEAWEEDFIEKVIWLNVSWNTETRSPDTASVRVKY